MHTPPCDDFYITRVTPLFDMYILSKSGYQYFFFAFIISSVLCKNTDSLKCSIVSDKGWRVEGLNVKNTESQLKSIFKMIYIIFWGVSRDFIMLQWSLLSWNCVSIVQSYIYVWLTSTRDYFQYFDFIAVKLLHV